MACHHARARNSVCWSLICGLSALAATWVSPLAAQSQAPLPDLAVFLAKVRSQLFTDEELQRDYTYLEKREEIRVSKLGRVHIAKTRLFEVYPSPEPGHRYRRLIADNGVPLDPKDLQRRDAEYQKYVTDLQRSREHETPTDRARREAKAAAERRERDQIVDDVYRVFQAQLVGRDTVDGHSAIVVSLTPRPNVIPRSKPGKYFPKFKGRVWINESEHQVMKADLESTEAINVGWGIVGRVQDGSRFTFERQKINGEVWLPRLVRIEMHGRSVLFRKFDLAAAIEYSNYRKFSVSTSETFQAPSPQ